MSFKKCLICNENFKDVPSHLEARKYCSMSCRNIGMKGNQNVANAVKYYRQNPIFCQNCEFLLTKSKDRKFKMHIPQCPVYLIKKKYRQSLIKINHKELGYQNALSDLENNSPKICQS